ncbi:MAG: hypothetical protein ACSHW9_01230 [Salinibacterium amurskyense]
MGKLNADFLIRLIVGTLTVTAWVSVFAVTVFVVPGLYDAGWVLAAAFVASLVTIWSWNRAKSANDFVTATSTSRIVVVVLLAVVVETIIGDSETNYATSQLGFLLAPAGLALLLLTDFVRMFTIPKRPRQNLTSRPTPNETSTLKSDGPHECESRSVLVAQDADASVQPEKTLPE